MLWPLRRALPGLACGAVLVLAGCGGAGYGDPIAATDGGGETVALAPAPVTTPGAGSTSAPSDAPATSSTVGRPATTTGGGEATTGDGGSTGTSDDDGGGSTGGDGGGDSGDGGLAAYAADVNRFCKGFNAATKALTTDIGATGASDPKTLGRAIVRYGEAMTAASEGIEAAPPPSSVRSFHERTLSWVSGLTDVIDANRSGLQSGSTDAGVAVIQKVKDLGKPPATPASLRSRATACTT
ncbi:hypothetical protein AB0L40_21015 [Patulibacter sp. NPDC049589]|uniref:hypothetical protein n=1 Tax=Patulibacter sp. NPDC049589 TaxID=3154731 RepID=UPI00341B0CF5